MTKQEIIDNFDPSQPRSEEATIFGLPFTDEQSEIIVLPVPWEVTVSYGSGASNGPEAVYNASFHIDLNHQFFPELWKLGIYYDQVPKDWKSNSDRYKVLAQSIIKELEKGETLSTHADLRADAETINKVCKNLNNQVKEKTLYWLNKGKKVALLGGDHSTPLGYYEALATKHPEFGILHIDAQMNLRNAYEGFTYSHASIMYNALQLPQIKKLVQVGVRDFCTQEVDFLKNQGYRIVTHTDQELKDEAFHGKSWHEQCEQIIMGLPPKVCISFDVDGMNAFYCPHTGAPVPGGLSFEQATYLFDKIAASNKEIIGFALVEVAPGENDHWDGDVGARMLFHLCGAMAKNNRMPVGEKITFHRY